MHEDKNDPRDPGLRASPPSDLQVRLAAERTLLAWIRTGLPLMGFGFVVARLGLFLREMAGRTESPGGTHPGLSLGMGTGLILLGVVVCAISAARHRRFIARLDQGLPGPTSTGWLGVGVAAALSILGITMAVYLVTVGR